MHRFTNSICIGVAFLFCLGAAHAQHMNAPEAPCHNAGTTVDTDNCFGKAAKDADSKLNQTYSQILSILRPADQQNLRAAQRLWIQFRDATCNAEKALYENGTGAYPAYLACIEEETRLRTHDLQVTYGWEVEKFSK